MEHVLFSKDIRMSLIVKLLNDKLKGYGEYKLININENGLNSSILIKLYSDSCKNKQNKKTAEVYLEHILNELKKEETGNTNFEYLLYKIVEFNNEEQFYNAIKKKCKNKTIAGNRNVEKQLIDAIIYFGDRCLFIDCNYEKAKKWYELVNSEAFHEENFKEIKKFTSNIDYFYKNGFFQYISQNNRNKYDLLIKLTYLDGRLDFLDISNYVDYTNSIFDFYFSIKDSIKNFDEARKIFCETLYKINGILIQNIESIKNSKQNLKAEERNNITFLSSIVYQNDLVVYKDYIVNHTNSKSIIDTIFNIVDSIINIERIKKNLLVSDTNNINLAYYTKIDSFSYMLPYKNIHDKAGYLPLMNISYMNDPTEGTVIYRYLGVKNGKNKRDEAKFPYIFIKSFTSSIDYLPMWEMYGDKAKGICVVLDWPKIKKENIELYRICYISIANNEKHKIIVSHNQKIKNIKRIKEELEVLKNIRNELDESLLNIYDESLNKIAYLFKDDHYYTEEEYRIIQSDKEYNKEIRKSIKSNDDIKINDCPLILKYGNFIPYIKEIIIGPKYEKVDLNFPFIKTQIELMCKQVNMEIPKITYSDIDYR